MKKNHLPIMNTLKRLGAVIAWLGPAIILEHDQMESIWGTISWIGNTLIFTYVLP